MQKTKEWTTEDLHRSALLDRLLALLLEGMLFYGFALILGVWLNGAHFDTSGKYGSSLTLVLDRTIEDGRLYALLLLVLVLVFGFWALRKISLFFILFIVGCLGLGAGVTWIGASLGAVLDAQPSAAITAARAADPAAIVGSLHTGTLLALGIVSALQIVVTFYRRTRALETDARGGQPPMVMAALFLVYDLAAWLLGRPLLMRLFVVLLAVWLLLHTLVSVRMGRTGFLQENLRTANLPAEQITATGRAVTAVFLFAVILGVLFLYLLPLERLLPLFEGARQALLAFLLGLFGPNPAVEEAQQQTLDFSTMDAGASGIAALFPAEPNPVLEFLADVFLWVVLAAVAYGIIVTLFKAVKRLYKGFYSQGRIITDETESLIRKPMAKERIDAGAEDRIPLLFGTPSQKVRRLYRRYVTKQNKDLQKAALRTPAELETATDAAAARRIALYEKARYSPDGAADADVDAMKHACRNL